MTVGALHLQHPSSPSIVEQSSSDGSDRSKVKVSSKKVTFFSQVRVHRRKIDNDEEDIPRSDFWYSRSELRAMKQDILAFRKIWRHHQLAADDDIDDTDERPSEKNEAEDVNEQFDENEYCPRGVEIFLYPQIRKLREKRRDALLFSLMDAKDSIDGDRGFCHPIEDGSSSHSDDSTFSYQSINETMEEESQQAVLEAIHRADQDAQDAMKVYSATCAEIQHVMNSKAYQKKRRSKLESKNGRTKVKTSDANECSNRNTPQR